MLNLAVTTQSLYIGHSATRILVSVFHQEDGEGLIERQIGLTVQRMQLSLMPPIRHGKPQRLVSHGYTSGFMVYAVTTQTWVTQCPKVTQMVLVAMVTFGHQ